MITSTELSGSGMRFDRALEELDVGGAGLPLVLARERQHLVGHVEAVGLAGRADALGREQHVDAAARSEIEHDVCPASSASSAVGLPQPSDAVTASAGKPARFRVRVQIGGDRIAAAAWRSARSSP